MFHFRRLSILCLALLCTAAGAFAAPFEHPYPEALQIRMDTEMRGQIAAEIPVTFSEAVNQKLREAADALYAQVTAHTDCRVDLSATYRVSGTKWVGFLLTARAVELDMAEDDDYTVEDTAALYFRTQAYDMETGEALTLADVFSNDSAAWGKLADAAQALLYSYYPGEARNTDTLEQMAAPDSLRQLSFLPCAGRLLVPFPLEQVLPDHPQIAWLAVPYPDYRSLMRPQAMLQTDNSTRPMIALTFDDGPSRITTQAVLDALAYYGASATFFSVGDAVNRQPDLLRREADFGHTVGAHSMTHADPWAQPVREMASEYAAQKLLFQETDGLAAVLFRPPGGDLKTYITRQIGWPLIRWNKSGSDTGPIDSRQIASHVIASVEHGDIVLMHDTKAKTAAAVPRILKALQERGFMFATVDELLYLNGITPQPNVGYNDGLGESIYPD